jgi:hypothetical protein
MNIFIIAVSMIPVFTIVLIVIMMQKIMVDMSKKEK